MRRPGRIPLAMVAPALWLGAFFLAPFLMVAAMSLSEVATAIPPYQPVFTLADGPAGWVDKARRWSLANYALIAGDRLYVDAFLTSLRIAALATALLVLIGYPIAHAMARAPDRAKPILIALVILPFWTSFLIRAYAWIGILKPEGYLNGALMSVGLIREPLMVINTEWAVMIALVYCYLPFMALPIYASLERMDRSLIDAAADLGASPALVFARVTLPLSLPGVVAGALLCFIPIMGEVVVPDLLGGAETLMIGKTLWTEFFSNRDWPVASAVAVILLVALVGPILAHQRLQARDLEARR